MYDISDRIISLRLMSRRAVTLSGSKTKGTMTLEQKILFLLSSKPSISPNDVISSLNITKTNASAIVSAMVKKGYATKTKNVNDKREIKLQITEFGREILDKIKANINKSFQSIITSDEQYSDCANSIDKVLEILSFLP